MKVGSSSKAKSAAKPKDAGYFSLNFAKYRRHLIGFRKTTTNTQIIGFTNNDSYKEVLGKACKGLNVKYGSTLSLICSNGEVLDSPINEKPWTLGEYINHNGGSHNRSKKVWGIYIPIDNETITSFTSISGSFDASTKRSHCSLSSTSSKRQKLLTEMITINSSESEVSLPIIIPMHDVTVKYCPCIGERLHASIVAVGQIGVWRISQFDLVSSDEAICSDMKREDDFQPESQGFYVVEISRGKTQYLKCDVSIGSTTSVIKNDVKYYVKEERVIRSETKQNIKEGEYARLLVLVPNHGRITYTWNKMQDRLKWVKLNVPSDTCLLYTKCPGTYSCDVSDEIYFFEVEDREVTMQSEDVIKAEDVKFNEVIGQGGFGVVHHGNWKGREVALKRIKLPAGTNSSSLPTPMEVSVLKSLKHPNIITFIGYFMMDGNVILMTNFVKGSNLDTLIFSKNSELTEFTATDIAVKIADAVNYMHTHDPIVIHQDLKPQNVLISLDHSKVYLCDMGIAKVKQLTEATVTSTNKGPGTYPYMAPEMYKKSRRGAAVDVYSLGCLYIELFGRRRVWPGLDGPDIMLKVLGAYNTPPQAPNTSHLPNVFRDLCSAMCNLDSTLRPTSGEVFLAIQKISSY